MAKRPRDLADETLDILARLRARRPTVVGGRAEDNHQEDEVLTVVSSPHTPEEAFLAVGLLAPGGKGDQVGESAGGTVEQRSQAPSAEAGAHSAAVRTAVSAAAPDSAASRAIVPAGGKGTISAALSSADVATRLGLPGQASLSQEPVYTRWLHFICSLSLAELHYSLAGMLMKQDLLRDAARLYRNPPPSIPPPLREAGREEDLVRHVYSLLDEEPEAQAFRRRLQALADRRNGLC